jgi:hypothetical protein
VAELADALDSKSCVLTGVWVRVPPSVPIIVLQSLLDHAFSVMNVHLPLLYMTFGGGSLLQITLLN